MTTTHDSGMPLEPSAVLARRPAPHVEWIEIEGETIAWNADTAELHRLDPIATLVFQLCDGAAPLRETVTDLAGAFGQPPAAVERDVMAFATKMRDDGLLEVAR